MKNKTLKDFINFFGNAENIKVCPAEYEDEDFILEINYEIWTNGINPKYNKYLNYEIDMVEYFYSSYNAENILIVNLLEKEYKNDK